MSRLHALLVVLGLAAEVGCGDDPVRERGLVMRDTFAEAGPAAPPDGMADSENADGEDAAETTAEPSDSAEPPDAVTGDTRDTTPSDTTPSDTLDTGPGDTLDTGDAHDTSPADSEAPVECVDGRDCALIGAGWTGAACASDGDCGPVGSLCIPDVGSCSIACSAFCDDEPEAPVTFCIDAADYASRMAVALPAERAGGLCVAKCDFVLFPRTGCRADMHCELHTRYEQLVDDEVCVPGPWSVGLELSADGAEVLGVDDTGPALAEPYATLVAATCAGGFGSVPAHLFRGLADTLMAMGPEGRGRSWERLCTPPPGLPDRYGLHAEAGHAFRLSGARLEVVDWTAYALYGATTVLGYRIGGPLYPARVMVYRSGASAWLYADGADDHPHPDPDAGRHFGLIEGEEWAPLESALEPDIEYKARKAASPGRFQRQWGRVETIGYLADMALDHLVRHGVMLGFGDVSLATGGDIDDHSSHEVGLDVDVYLLTFPPDASGEPDRARPIVWVADCDDSGGWDCWYYDNEGGGFEDPSAPLHVEAALMLETLAQYALDHAGPSWFVQHDVVTLTPFRALGGSAPHYVDATNDAASGWPVHQNHVHVRFYDW